MDFWKPQLGFENGKASSPLFPSSPHHYKDTFGRARAVSKSHSLCLQFLPTVLLLTLPFMTCSPLSLLPLPQNCTLFKAPSSTLKTLPPKVLQLGRRVRKGAFPGQSQTAQYLDVMQQSLALTILLFNLIFKDSKHPNVTQCAESDATRCGLFCCCLSELWIVLKSKFRNCKLRF